jgi:sugar phosphate isomerase/epimerase
MQPGIFARTFERPVLAEALDAAAASGVETIQFNMALVGGPSLPRRIPPAGAAAIRAAVRARGLTMAAVSGTYNMAHPDRAVRDDGAARLHTLIAAAPALGTRVVTLCTGTRDPDDMWRAHSDNASAEAWADSLEQIAAAVRVAEAHEVVLAFEPEHNNVVGDARSGRRLLDELPSPSLRVVLDGANLIRPGELSRQGETLREAVALLGDALVLAHAKDVRDDGTIVAAGRGDLDYPLYVRLLDDAGYAGPLVLHGLSEAEVPAAVRFLRDWLAPFAPTG